MPESLARSPSLSASPSADAAPARRPLPQLDLGGVRAASLCIGCGACVHADPTLRLVFDDDKQMFEPSGAGGAAAAAVCPSVQVDFADLQRRVFGPAEVTPLGVVDSVWLAQSTHRERNLKASSGGLIKEILHELLARDDVDGAIVLGHEVGLRFAPRLIRTADEIDGLPGSIYHNLPFDGALRLLAENEGRFVLVAIPCQLEGIYNYIYKLRPELARRIYTTIGLICGWQYTYHALRAICCFKGVPFDDLKEVSYRGGGPVGRLRLATAERQYAVHRRVDFSYQVAFDRSFNIPRCHVCIDHSNFLAEIVVGDAWLPSTVHTRTGISIVVCRTPRARQFIDALLAAGRIRATQVSPQDLVESQSRRIAYGDFAYAYADYLREIGAPCPDMDGPNRPAARLVSRGKVAAFHRQVMAKMSLQRRRRYRVLWLRKATLELGPFAMRYVRWFLVRVLRIKSLLGVRKEVARQQLSEFL